VNILFTNIGRRTYFVDYALELKRSGYPIRIFVSDTSMETAGFWVSSEVTQLLTPRVSGNEQRYIADLTEKCLKYEIELIIPMMDYELPVFAKRKNDFANHGIQVIISEYDTIMNCLDKKNNYEFCLKNDVSVPQTCFNTKDILPSFPLIKKRIMGSGSVGLHTIRYPGELVLFEEGVDLLQACLEGTEYGMDILNDLEGNFVHSFVREKLSMRSGETDKARGVFFDRFTDLAKTISSKFRHVGNMDVDFFEDGNGETYFIDFNPRFGGGYPLTHVSGYNYLQALLDMVMNRPVNFPTDRKKLVLLKGISVQHFSE
jgi:carbamoyl-phosphate synthase large subunit